MIRNNIKKVIAIVLMSTAIIGTFSTGASAAWREDSSGWWYTEGSSWATGWRQINGNWYYFSPRNGYMYIQTTIDGCYVNENGIWVDDSAFNVGASKAEELVREKYRPETTKTGPHIKTCNFDGYKWTVHVYYADELMTYTVGWYYVDKNTGNISSMY
jgi:hypothetical protein